MNEVLMFLMYLLLVFSGIFVFYITTAFVGFLMTWVPFVTTPDPDIKEMLKHVKVTSQDIFYELGSGNGKVCFMVESFSGAKTVGFELTLWLYVFSILKAFIAKSKAEFYLKDFFKADWSKASVIYTYMYFPLMPKIEEKFLRECPKGARAILRDFKFPNLKPEKSLKTHNGHMLFFYIK